MKAYKIPFTIIAFLLFTSISFGQRRIPMPVPTPTPVAEQSPVSFVYDADFALAFNNREYDLSNFQPSGTIFGIRLTPSVGVEVRRNGQLHKLMVGIDVEKDFGDKECENAKMLSEVTAYYKFRKDFLSGRQANRFEMTFGIFPKSMMQEDWSIAFFGGKQKWYDNNMEGALFAWSDKNSRIELGCDWMGKIGSSDYTREQFMIMSAGHTDLLSGLLRLGYNGYGVHYANSTMVKGVVDNILAEPYARVNLGKFTGRTFQEFYTKFGYFGSLQRDRRISSRFDYSMAGEFTLGMKKWNVKLENNLYYGSNLMPYFNKTDAAGIRYGDNLYYQDAFFQFRDNDHQSYAGIYDCVTLSYLPRICNGVRFGVHLALHFHSNGLSGNQEMLMLSVNLRELMGR